MKKKLNKINFKQFIWFIENIYIYKVEKNFYSVKQEKETKENKFYKFIWFRGEANNFLRFYKL